MDKSELVDELERLIEAIDASGRATLPRSNLDLLQSIVDAAARIFGAAASSIALVDENTQELVFKVAVNATDKDLIGLRIPIDKGIAGYVAMTGQPLAVSNVQQDARFNREFAQSTGYVPNSILAVPLNSGDRVIGVIEVLDKINAPTFGLQDIELLGIFARQAALAISQSQFYDEIGEALVRGLRSILTSMSDQDAVALDEIIAAVKPKAPDDLIELAGIFQDLAALGQAERRICIQVLEAFRQYRRTKTLRRF